MFARKALSAVLVTAAVALACFTLVAKEKSPSKQVAKAKTTEEAAEIELKLQAVEDSIDGCFTTSETCATCHSSIEDTVAMRDSRGESVAPYDLWQSSMMANASRDPLWRAMVSTEVMATPSRKKEIEAKCMQCHAPMAATEKTHAGTQITMAELYDKDARHNQLALDGASCTLCHQVTPENFGKHESFSGHFNISKERVAFGPHKDPFIMPMEGFTGLTPTYGSHITSSELCATCHTLYTQPYDPDGTPVDAKFVEQSPYLEWQNSVFASEPYIDGQESKGGASCQTCHMPRFDEAGKEISTTLARAPGGFDFPLTEKRSPYGRHILVGGNTLVPQMLALFADDLKPSASAAAFKKTEELARKQLRTSTAKVSINKVSESDETLNVQVEVQNLCGHKFPSAHPIRRAWLEFTVRDAKGKLLFQSGMTDKAFNIVGADGKALASELVGGPALPHYDEIGNSNEVQIYSGEMKDRHGNLTHTLMRAAGYSKDNRLLPMGWNPKGRNIKDIKPIGTEKDANFGAGRDSVTYKIPHAAIAKSPGLQVKVRLLYQTLSTRHQAEILKYDTPEVRDLRKMLKAVNQGPELVAEYKYVIRRQTIKGN